MEHQDRPDRTTTSARAATSNGWEEFHDHLDEQVESLDEGTHLELTELGSRWMIRISAGWAGIDGPGTLAFHLQIGSNRAGALGAWSSTQFGRSHGYSATRVAGEISALGLESDPTGISNPSMIACGSVAHLEVSDVAVELLREVFTVSQTEHLLLRVGSPDSDTDPRTEADDQNTCATADADLVVEEPWWAQVAFDEAPEVDHQGEIVVGYVDNVLVEAKRDSASLPGLTLVVARARLTDPNALPLALPSADAAALMHWMRTAGGEGISIDTVRSAGRTVHGWATRILCSDGADTPLTRIDALDGPEGDAEAAAEAVGEVISFVKSARRSEPQVIRPTRLTALMDD